MSHTHTHTHTHTQTHTHTHTLRIYNIYCVSKATMVTRTHIYVMLYEMYIACFILTCNIHWLTLLIEMCSLQGTN